MGFKSIAVNHFDRSFKQSSDVVLERDVIEYRHAGRRIDFDQNIYITVRPIVSARNRPEKRRMTDAP